MPPEPALLERIYALLIGLVMIALIAIVLFTIFMRGMFNAPLFASEDITRVIFLWGVFLAMPLAVWRGQNMRVTLLTDRLPPRLRFWLDMGLHLLVLVFLAVLFRLSLPLVELALRGRMLTTGWSNAVLRLPLTVGIALCFAAQFLEIWKTLRARRSGG